MRIGLHVPVGAGYEAAVDYARSLGCAGGAILRRESEDVSHDRVRSRERSNASARCGAANGIDPAVIHTSYLINLASEDPKIAASSLRLLKSDLAFAGAGGVRYVNTHLGSYGKRAARRGFRASRRRRSKRRSRRFRRASSSCSKTPRARGNSAAGRSKNSASSCARSGIRSSAFASIPRMLGPPVTRSTRSTASTVSSRSSTSTSRSNGSRSSISTTRRFRSAGIATGIGTSARASIGFAGFRALLAHPELQGKTAILETPGDEADDRRNMAAIRTILEGVSA